MADSSDEKARYYQRGGVVDTYDAWRFGSPGGQYVHTREAETVLRWHNGLPFSARILDLPVGTGRVASLLTAEGYTAVHGADLSEPMLAVAGQAIPTSLRLTRQNAFQTAFADGAFDVVVSLRFFFHFPLQATDTLLDEFRRILAPGGRLIFDTLRWSPRAFFPRLQEGLGGRVYCHADPDVEKQLKAHGFEVHSTERLFLFPSLVYRFVPGRLVALARGIDHRSPSVLRSKTLWLVTRHENA
jgi:SAM-dependent methyltransferase